MVSALAYEPSDQGKISDRPEVTLTLNQSPSIGTNEILE
jgi:hypothetical protein